MRWPTSPSPRPTVSRAKSPASRPAPTRSPSPTPVRRRHCGQPDGHLPDGLQPRHRLTEPGHLHGQPELHVRPRHDRGRGHCHRHGRATPSRPPRRATRRTRLRSPATCPIRTGEQQRVRHRYRRLDRRPVHHQDGRCRSVVAGTNVTYTMTITEQRAEQRHGCRRRRRPPGRRDVRLRDRRRRPTTPGRTPSTTRRAPRCRAEARAYELRSRSSRASPGPSSIPPR